MFLAERIEIPHKVSLVFLQAPYKIVEQPGEGRGKALNKGSTGPVLLTSTASHRPP